MKLVIHILPAILCLHAFAQREIHGTVSDTETNESLIGAEVYFPDLKKGTITDVNGVYSIDDLPTGRLTVQISFIGYDPQVIEVDLTSSNQTLDVRLKESAREMNEVIVTGVSASTERRLSPIPAAVKNKKYLLHSSATNIVDAIAKIPGMDQLTTGQAISKPIIRGLGYNRVLTLLNGVRQEGQQWGDEHGIEIDEFSIDKVEVIKGPGSIAYGSDAMAGVINFQTPKEEKEGRISANVETEYQSNSNLYGLSAFNSGKIHGINWQGRVTRKEAGNYKNSLDGKVFNSGFNELDFNGALGINKKWGFSNLSFSNFHQNIGIVEGDRSSTGSFTRMIKDNTGQVVERPVTKDELDGYQLDIPRQSINHFRISDASHIYFSRSNLSIDLAFQQNIRKEFGNPANPSEEGLYFKLNTYNYSFKYAFPEQNNWNTVIGFNGMYQSNANLGQEFLIPAYNLMDGGLFVLTQRKINSLLISGGLRVDNRHISSDQLILQENGAPVEHFEAISTNFSNITGSAGLSYQAGKHWTLKLNLARAFRAPTLAELSSNGVHEGTFRYEIGNPDLKAETSLQSDMGILFENKHVSFETGLFLNHISNYIFLQKLLASNGADSIPDPAEPVAGFTYTQGTANLYGGETGIDIHPHPLDWLHFQTTYAITYAKQENQPDSMRNLPLIPAPKLRSELRANIAHVRNWMRNAYIKVELARYFDQNRIFSAFNTETATPGYTLINAGIGGTIYNKKNQPALSIFITANNLFDKAYQSHLSRLKFASKNLVTGRTGVFNMGRNITFKLTIPLVFRAPDNQG